MSNTVIWVGRIAGELYADHNDQDIHKLNATAEQVHSALTQNGWIRISANGKELVGNYIHSANWPLDQSAEPLKEFYAHE